MSSRCPFPPQGQARPPRTAPRLPSQRAAGRRRRLALEFLEDRTVMSTSFPLNSATWTPIGPASIGGTSSFGGGNGGPSSGRDSGIAADPTDPNTIYVAATGGGVWKTTNGGGSWLPLTDNQPGLFMGSIALAPSNPKVIYAGTGQADNSGDSYYGEGVLKSTDAGATWALTGQSDFNRKAVVKIAVNPTDPTNAYAAVANPDVNGLAGNNGIWETTDGGATWTNTTTAITTNDDFTDVVINPANPLVLYAAVGDGGGSKANGVYKTTDGGKNWAPAGNFPSGVANGRINFAIAASNPSEVVASVSDPANGGLKYLLKTTDAGATWVNQTSAPNYLGGQGSYDNTVAVSPTDPNVIFAAGVIDYGKRANEIIESRDGGASWNDVSADAKGNQPHTDLHASTFDAAGNLLIAGDGGIWRLDNAQPGSLLWTDINSNLQTVEFVGNSLDPSNADVVYGGSQDNGTEKFTDNKTWKQVFGGDGGFTAVDPSNPQTVYGEYVDVNLYRSDDGGASFHFITTGISKTDPVNFYAPYTVDPSNPSHLLYGTNHLYTTTTKGEAWTVLATPGTAGFNAPGAPVNTVTIAPTNPSIIYVGTDAGDIYVSTDAGATWNQRDIPADHDSVEKIVVDPADPMTAYAVRGTFNSGGNTGHVFKTANAGATWTDVSGNLPDLPAHTFAVDDRRGGRIYVGTDRGVYESSDGGTTWSTFKVGLPNVQVTTLELNPGLDILMAGTYGRGVFEIKSSDSVTVVADPITTVEGTALVNVQVAQFTDTTGTHPASTYSATIDWGDGTAATAGTVVALSGGGFGVDGSHTYTTPGTYTFTVTVTGTPGNTGTAKGTTTVGDAAITTTPVSITSVEATPFTGVVGDFASADALAPLADFTASINWGDGHVTTGTIAALGGGKFSVSGANTYARFGNYTVAVAVTDIYGSTGTINSPAVITDAPITSTPKTFSGVAGVVLSATVATFVDADPNAPISSYNVTINWGDGSAVTTLANGATLFNEGTDYAVQAGHTYRKFGTYTVVVTVNGGDTTATPPASSSTADSTAVIADAGVRASGVSFSVIEGQTYAGPVATFSTANPFADAADYSATVNWGDGTAATAGTVSSVGGRFTVAASHVYTGIGAYPTAVRITSAGGQSAAGGGTATVNPAPISIQSTPIAAVAGQPISDTLATVIDSYAGAPAADITATVDWGDGSAAGPATVTQPGGVGTPFLVSVSPAAGDSHAYAQAGGYTVTVTATERGGVTATGTAAAAISDAPVTAAAVAVPPLNQGQIYAGLVATFTTPNAQAPTGFYLAQIDWGDGVGATGRVNAVSPGAFSVTPDPSSGGQHSYAQAGSYTITTTVISLFSGTRSSASEVVTVNDAPIVGTPGSSLAGVAGTVVGGLLGSFTQFPGTPVEDFTATVNWGDGSSTAATVTAGSGGGFDVNGSHLYTSVNYWPVAVTVRDAAGSVGTFGLVAAVSDAAITGAGVAVSAVQGTPFGGTLATFTDANVYAQAGEFKALVNWGDGSAVTLGTVTGSGGSFQVAGSHTYTASRAGGFAVTVRVLHAGGGNATATATATVLVPLSGALSPSSDSGVSNSDGITNVTRPVITGLGQAGATVQVYAAPSASPASLTQVGTGLIDATGHWSITIGALSAGSYRVTATMTDPTTGITVESVPVRTGAGGSPLVIATAGPTISSVAFNPATGKVTVLFQGGLAGLNTSALVSPAGYGLARAVGLGLTTYAAGNVAVAAGPNGQTAVTLTYALGKRIQAGVYVMTLHAAGIADLAGNPLYVPYFLTFPQTTNYPNPDYVAQFTVAANGAASGPQLYVSRAEQIAAHRYSTLTQSTKVVRVPVVAASAYRPSTFARRR